MNIKVGIGDGYNNKTVKNHFYVKIEMEILVIWSLTLSKFYEIKTNFYQSYNLWDFTQKWHI